MQGREVSTGWLVMRVVLLAAGITLLAAALAGAVTVGPTDGVTFVQFDLIESGVLVADSSIGAVTVDIATLRAVTGVYSGFVNVRTAEGWVVQNLPVFAEFGGGTIGTHLKLADVEGVPITTLLAQVDFSPLPTATFAGAGEAAFSVGNRLVEVGGKEEQPAVTRSVPPPPGAVVFDPFGLTYSCCQEGHSNVQAAKRQCGPAAAANSLDWLAVQNWPLFWTLPLNVPGLGNDGSLVGGLETAMGRTFRNRRDGDGIGDRKFLEGKLCYLEQRWIAHLLDVKHQDEQFGDADVRCPSGFATSKARGKPPTAQFVIDEICSDEDVEIGYSWPGGGHWVTGVCAGQILGVPFVIAISDADQGSDLTGTGPEGTDYMLLKDTDHDGMLNLANLNKTPEMDIVVSESPRPEIDRFEWFTATVVLESDFMFDRIELAGTGVLLADVQEVADRDADGLDEIPVELLDLDLRGHSEVWGEVTLRVDAGGAIAQSPHPTAAIEERVNATPGVLDLPPFAPAGTANISLRMPLALQLGASALTTGEAASFGGVVTFKPAAPLESYYLLSPLPLRTPEGLPVAVLLEAAVLTPLPRLDAFARPWINAFAFTTGHTLISDLTLANPGVAVTADVFYGIVLPDGSLLFITNLSPLGWMGAPFEAPRRFVPLLTDVELGAGSVLPFPGAFSHTFEGWEWPGTYSFFAALVRPDAFHDNRIDAGDVIALETQPFTFYPATGTARRRSGSGTDPR